LTISILTRVCESELPYLTPFLEYHSKSGISSFHIIIQDRQLESKIKTLCSHIRANVNFCFMDKKLTPDQCLRAFQYSAIKTEYTLLIDIDEFFYSPVHQSIQNALISMGCPDWIYPFWIMAPSDFDSSNRAWGYLGHIGKHIVRTSLIEGIISPHVFYINDEGGLNSETQFLYRPNDCFIIHYWGRTFTDCLLKMVMHHGMGKMRQTSVNQLIQLSNEGKCAPRLKLLALLTTHPRYIKIPDLLNNKIDHELEQRLIESYFNDKQLSTFKTVYLKYKAIIKKQDISAVYPGRGELRQVLDFLPD